MATKITPTVGRVVLYRPGPGNPAFSVGVDHAALVAKVNDDGTLNLGVLDMHGAHHAMRDVSLVQEGEEAPKTGAYAQWMPYQLGQAKKTEEAQKAADAASATKVPPK